MKVVEAGSLDTGDCVEHTLAGVRVRTQLGQGRLYFGAENYEVYCFFGRGATHVERRCEEGEEFVKCKCSERVSRTKNLDLLQLPITCGDGCRGCLVK